jgi:hypothetical protein
MMKAKHKMDKLKNSIMKQTKLAKKYDSK